MAGNYKEVSNIVPTNNNYHEKNKIKKPAI
jgi:hypothetical protein